MWKLTLSFCINCTSNDIISSHQKEVNNAYLIQHKNIKPLSSPSSWKMLDNKQVCHFAWPKKCFTVNTTEVY